MPETAAPPIKDFADMAFQSMKTDPDLAPAPEKVEPVRAEPVKVEKQERGIPEGLFDKTEKKVEPVVEPDGSEIDKIAEPNFRDPKNKGGWDTLKSKAKDLETKYGEAQKKLADLEARGKNTADIEAKMAKMEKDHAELQAKYAEADSTIKKRYIEDDPEYRKNFVDGRKELVEHAKKIAKDSGLNPTDMEAALALKGEAGVRALEAAAEGMGSFQQGRLGQIVTAIEKLDAEAERLRGDPENFMQQREEQETERKNKERDAHIQSMSRAFRDGMREVSSEAISLQKLEGEDNGWWNGKIDSDFQTAQKMWETGLHPKDAAKMLILGIASKRVEEAFIDMREQRNSIRSERDTMKAELEKLYGNGSPSISRGSASPSKDGKSMDFASRVIETAQIPK